jgi:uncharacterized membrane protein
MEWPAIRLSSSPRQEEHDHHRTDKNFDVGIAADLSITALPSKTGGRFSSELKRIQSKVGVWP